jgi:hypothetical protein
MAFLTRSEITASRLFPEVPSIYSSSSGNSLTAIADSPMSWIPRYCGWRLEIRNRLTRLFFMHRAAIAEEQAGNWRASDFYFREVLRQLKATPSDSEAWQVMAREISGPGSGLGAKEIYRRALQEVFIDTHCGFYNGYSQLTEHPSPDSRQFFHLDCLSQLVDMAGDGNSRLHW